MDQHDFYKTFLVGDESAPGGVEGNLFDFFEISDNADNFLPFYPSPYRSGKKVSTY